MWHGIDIPGGLARIIICGALATLLALGTGCALSQNVRDLQPAPDQPPLEELPRQN